MAGDTLSSRRRTSHQNAPSDLLERDAELEQIAAPLRGALDVSGGSVVIEGAPGIGKTSLLEKAAELAQADGMTPLRARGGVMESEFALGVMLQLPAPSIEELSGDERESVSRAPQDWRGRSSRRSQTERQRTIASWRASTACTGSARGWRMSGPLVLLVDDAHWADEQSLRFLAYLEARIEEIPACVILTVRTGEAAAAPEALSGLIGSERLVVVRPRPLSPGAIGQLVRARRGGQATGQVCDACARATGGNPLLTRQLVAAREERAAGRADLDPGSVAAVGPPSVAAFVAARLRSRSQTVAAVAQALAIFGDDASLAHAAELPKVDRQAAADAVDALIEAELLDTELPPRFVHPIVQQELQESIPPAERVQLHLAAARALARDPARRERAAAHLLAAAPAGPVSERWAFDALTDAARRAENRGSLEQAVRFLRYQ